MISFPEEAWTVTISALLLYLKNYVERPFRGLELGRTFPKIGLLTAM